MLAGRKERPRTFKKKGHRAGQIGVRGRELCAQTLRPRAFDSTEHASVPPRVERAPTRRPTPLPQACVGHNNSAAHTTVSAPQCDAVGPTVLVGVHGEGEDAVESGRAEDVPQRVRGGEPQPVGQKTGRPSGQARHSAPARAHEENPHGRHKQRRKHQRRRQLCSETEKKSKTRCVGLLEGGRFQEERVLQKGSTGRAGAWEVIVSVGRRKAHREYAR